MGARELPNERKKLIPLLIRITEGCETKTAEWDQSLECTQEECEIDALAASTNFSCSLYVSSGSGNERKYVLRTEVTLLMSLNVSWSLRSNES